MVLRAHSISLPVGPREGLRGAQETQGDSGTVHVQNLGQISDLVFTSMFLNNMWLLNLFIFNFKDFIDFLFWYRCCLVHMCLTCSILSSSSPPGILISQFFIKSLLNICITGLNKCFLLCQKGYWLFLIQLFVFPVVSNCLIYFHLSASLYLVPLANFSPSF